MTRDTVRLVVVATLALGGAILLATPARAETCVNAMPMAARDVRGYTFEGEILSITPGPEIEPGMPRDSDVSIAVSTVHANPTDRPQEAPMRAGDVIDIPSDACDGFGSVGVKVGSRVLISTSSRFDTSTWNTAVWERQGSSIRLLVLIGPDGTEVWLTRDRRLAEARTIRDALALVAPEAVGMPDTATDPHRPTVAGRPPGIALVAVSLALAVLAIAWRRLVVSRNS